MLNIKTKYYAFGMALCLTSCGGVKESLGITKDAPDEFAVVRHAPLEMPPQIILPPPRPGMPRPQEQTVTSQAKQAIFGHDTPNAATTSSSEAAILQKTGAGQADPNIRRTLDVESEEYEDKNKPVIKKILGLGGKKVEDDSETLDPKAESERLKKQNLPATELPPDWEKGQEKTEE